MRKETALGLKAIADIYGSRIPKEAVEKINEEAAKHEKDDSFSKVQALYELVELSKGVFTQSEIEDIEKVFGETYEDFEASIEFISLNEFKKAVFCDFDYEDAEFLCDAASYFYHNDTEELIDFIQAAKRIGFCGLFMDLYETDTYEVFGEMGIDELNDFLFWSKKEMHQKLDNVLSSDWKTVQIITVSSAEDALMKYAQGVFDADKVAKLYMEYSHLFDVKQVIKHYEEKGMIKYYENEKKLIINGN